MSRTADTLLGFEEAYFAWLCGLITKTQPKTYSRLLRELHRYDFTNYNDIKGDINRAQDGIELRSDFLNSKSPHIPEESKFSDLSEWMGQPCTMLELLIGLSYRQEHLFMESRYEETFEYWFWNMMHNIGLDKFSDDEYKDEYEMDIYNVVYRICFKKYGKDGKGGLFPLKHPKKNQRNIEIWYQLAAYALEVMNGDL